MAPQARHIHKGASVTDCFAGHLSGSKPHTMNIAGLVFDDTAAMPMGSIRYPLYAESSKLDSIPVYLAYLSLIKENPGISGRRKRHVRERHQQGRQGLRFCRKGEIHHMS